MSELSQALDAVDLASMVLSLAQSIVQAQTNMDVASLRLSQALATTRVPFDDEKVSLLELGFVPTFYQFTETCFELKVSISVTREESDEKTTSDSHTETETSTRSLGFFGSGGSVTKTTTHVTSVDTRLATRFQYSATGSSRMSTRIVPVPPPSQLMDVVHQVIKDSQSDL